MVSFARLRSPGMITALVALVLLVALGASTLSSLRNSLLADRAEQLAKSVRQAYSEVANYHRLATAGDMGSAAAREAALKALAGLRHSDNEYFWVTDYQGRLIMHPISPELEGRLLLAREQSSQQVLHDQVAKVLRETGAGFLHYLWPKPGSTLAVDKVGYVQGFEPWGWGIGSGVYVDDIDAAFWLEVQTLAGIGLILLVVLLLFWYGFHTVLFPSPRKRLSPVSRHS